MILALTFKWPSRNSRSKSRSFQGQSSRSKVTPRWNVEVTTSLYYKVTRSLYYSTDILVSKPWTSDLEMILTLTFTIFRIKVKGHLKVKCQGVTRSLCYNVTRSLYYYTKIELSNPRAFDLEVILAVTFKWPSWNSRPKSRSKVKVKGHLKGEMSRSQGHYMTRSQGHCITLQTSYCPTFWPLTWRWSWPWPINDLHRIQGQSQGHCITLQTSYCPNRVHLTWRWSWPWPLIDLHEIQGQSQGHLKDKVQGQRSHQGEM